LCEQAVPNVLAVRLSQGDDQTLQHERDGSPPRSGSRNNTGTYSLKIRPRPAD
jgi:hypothetical protein